MTITVAAFAPPTVSWADPAPADLEDTSVSTPVGHAPCPEYAADDETAPSCDPVPDPVGGWPVPEPAAHAKSSRAHAAATTPTSSASSSYGVSILIPSVQKPGLAANAVAHSTLGNSSPYAIQIWEKPGGASWRTRTQCKNADYCSIDITWTDATSNLYVALISYACPTTTCYDYDTYAANSQAMSNITRATWLGVNIYSSEYADQNEQVQVTADINIPADDN